MVGKGAVTRRVQPSGTGRARIGWWIVAASAVAIAVYLIVYPVAHEILTARIAGEWSGRPEIENWALPEVAAERGATRVAILLAGLATLSASLLGVISTYHRRT